MRCVNRINNRSVDEYLLTVFRAGLDGVIAHHLPLTSRGCHGVRRLCNRVWLDILKERDDPVQTGCQRLGTIARGLNGRNHNTILVSLKEYKTSTDSGQKERKNNRPEHYPDCTL